MLFVLIISKQLDVNSIILVKYFINFLIEIENLLYMSKLIIFNTF